jgi:hypothetical protein
MSERIKVYYFESYDESRKRHPRDFFNVSLDSDNEETDNDICTGSLIKIDDFSNVYSGIYKFIDIDKFLEFIKRHDWNDPGNNLFIFEFEYFEGFHVIKPSEVIDGSVYKRKDLQEIFRYYGVKEDA